MFLRSLSRSLLLTIPFIAGAIIAAPAHEVKIAEDVGATMHIEPNDIARAGAATEVWFALTQRGGRAIPLTSCDCQLTLYDSQNTVIQTPPLTAVSAEGFNDLPGATVIFPEVGAYDLVLSGSPQGAGEFSPFELSFTVTVASRAPNTANSETANSETIAPAASNSNGDVATSPDATDTEAPAAPSPETSAPAASSNTWRPVLAWGSAVVVVGLISAIIGGRRSPGGKQ